MARPPSSCTRPTLASTCAWKTSSRKRGGGAGLLPAALAGSFSRAHVSRCYFYRLFGVRGAVGALLPRHCARTIPLLAAAKLDAAHVVCCRCGAGDTACVLLLKKCVRLGREKRCSNTTQKPPFLLPRRHRRGAGGGRAALGGLRRRRGQGAQRAHHAAGECTSAAQAVAQLWLSCSNALANAATPPRARARARHVPLTLAADDGPPQRRAAQVGRQRRAHSAGARPRGARAVHLLFQRRRRRLVHLHLAVGQRARHREKRVASRRQAGEPARTCLVRLRASHGLLRACLRERASRAPRARHARQPTQSCLPPAAALPQVSVTGFAVGTA